MAPSPSVQIRMEIRVALEAFRVNEAGMTKLLRGPITADLSRRAIRVESAAKENATGRPGPNVITGRMRGSITWRLGQDATSPYADIGTSVFYAPFVEARYPFLRPALSAAR